MHMRVPGECVKCALTPVSETDGRRLMQQRLSQLLKTVSAPQEIAVPVSSPSPARGERY
jgi:hypothetical protein